MDIPLDRILKGASEQQIARFKVYHGKHPEVWKAFKDHANGIRDIGHKRYSAWVIINLIRWNWDIRKTEKFKIANGYIAFYARVLIYVHPRFAGFFELRPLTSGGGS